MTYLLRRKLICFYCGHKSSKTKDRSIRQWRCAECDAVNYLDENGDITDPPASATPEKSQTYAIEASRSISPDLGAPANNIFCSTCQKNQHIFVQALASYLPDPNDRKYREYERNLPEYKRKLEERYPQVCSKCVRLVNNRIESMTYLARTENLKLSLGKTKKGLMPYQNRTSWKDVVVFVGGCAWWTSVVGQLVWHLLGLSPQIQGAFKSNIPSCLIQSALTRSIDTGCYNAMTGILPMLLLSGVFSIWWNNQLAKSASGFGRLENLNEYWFFQAIFIIIRAGAFWELQQRHHLSTLHSERVHGGAIVFIIVFGFSSLNIVKIKRRPVLSDYKLTRVKAADSDALTLDDPSYSPQLEQTGTRARAFPISALAPSTTVANSVLGAKSCRRPSASTDMSSVFDRNWLNDQKGDDYSEMDWTPTQPAFTPRQPVQSKVVVESYTPAGSPFKHTLPPAPEHPAHKARKPPTQPTFHRAPEEKRNEFKENIRNQGKPSVLDSWGLPAEPTAAHEMDMGVPKLKLTQQETGLESLFNNVFSLQDDPREVQMDTTGTAGQPSGKARWVGATVWSLFIAVPLSVGAAWLLSQRTLDHHWDA